MEPTVTPPKPLINRGLGSQIVRILETQRRPMSCGEIALMAGVDKRTIQSSVFNLKKTGRITTLGREQWMALPPENSQSTGSTGRKISRDVSTRAWRVLVNHNVPMATLDVATEMGEDYHKVQGALYRLSKKGLTIQLAQTIFTAAPRVPVPPPEAYEPDEAVTAPVEAPVPVAAPVAISQPRVAIRSELSEQDQSAILEIMLPEGFQGRHYPAIQRWWASTEALVAEVRKG